MADYIFDELCRHPKKGLLLLEAAKSPEYGNALMDLLGEEIYNKIMILQRE